MSMQTAIQVLESQTEFERVRRTDTTVNTMMILGRSLSEIVVALSDEKAALMEHLVRREMLNPAPVIIIAPSPL